MPSLQIHRLAQQEFLDALEWYAEQGAASDVLDDFVAQYDDSLLHVCEWPLHGAPHLLGTRRLQLQRFPHGLIYRVREETVYVIALAHPKQRPGYWKDREF